MTKPTASQPIEIFTKHEIEYFQLKVFEDKLSIENELSLIHESFSDREIILNARMDFLDRLALKLTTIRQTALKR